MSKADSSQPYEELKYDSDGPGPEVATQEPKSPVHGGDLEAGLLQLKDAESHEETQGSSVSRALRSIRWKRSPTIREGEAEKEEVPQKPPEYTEEARKLVRSFTQTHLDPEHHHVR